MAFFYVREVDCPPGNLGDRTQDRACSVARTHPRFGLVMDRRELEPGRGFWPQALTRVNGEKAGKGVGSSYADKIQDPLY